MFHVERIKKNTIESKCLRSQLRNYYYFCKETTISIIYSMSTAELKKDLINRIANTDEPGIIEELSRLLDFELSCEPYKLNPEQYQRVSEAKSEYLAGNVLSEKQADESIDQWLNEK